MAGLTIYISLKFTCMKVINVTLMLNILSKQIGVESRKMLSRGEDLHAKGIEGITLAR